MNAQDWFVTSDGQCQLRPVSREWDLLREPYYLHQFLTETLDILSNASHEKDEWDYLPQIRRQVRQFILNSYWVKTQTDRPNPHTGVNVTTLYDEIGYPLTIQNVATQPGLVTSIHNHGTWGVVFQIQGEDRHRFWRRVSAPGEPVQIEAVGERILRAGEIISFHPDAIHQVETLGNTDAFTFQLYGYTQPQGRFQYQPEAQIAKPF